MPRPTLSYPRTEANTVHRLSNRASYDARTIHTVFSSAPGGLVHISFLSSAGAPSILPMLGALGSFSRPSASFSEPLDLYLHGYATSRLFRSPRDKADGIPVSVCATALDGLVMALTPFNHSFNYRSAVVHGRAHLVEDHGEKMYAMKLVTERVWDGRWEGSRVPPTKSEVDSTGILRVVIESASAKIREGMPGSEKKEEEEVKKSVWSGVVPCWIEWGEPVAGGDGKGEWTAEMEEERAQRNKVGREEAVRKARSGG